MGFIFVVIFIVFLWMTLLTEGLLKSVCRVRFVTYQDAFAMALRILYWNICMVTVLDLLAQSCSSNRSSI